MVFFCLFFLGNTDDFRFDIHVEVVVYLAVWNSAGKQGRDNLVALLHQWLDDAGNRVIFPKTVEYFGAADDLKVVDPGNDWVKGIGFVLKSSNQYSFHDASLRI